MSNEELKKIIEEINTHPDEKLAEKLEENLLKAEFIVPVIVQEEHNHDHDHDEEGEHEEEVSMSILPLQDEKGNIFLPVFTDEEEFNKSEKEMEAVLFDLETIYETALTEQEDLKGIVINPFSQYSIAPPKETIEDILSGE